MTNLTKQWKKGELPAGRYWVKYHNGRIRIDKWDLLEGITIETKPEITEVLAPVPSYEEWQLMQDDSQNQPNIRGRIMERFKFRVWDNKMQKFHLVFSFHGIVNDILEGYAKEDNFVLEQCTGLKDKNGRLIYEGDWLKTKYGYYCCVIWFDGFWMVKSLLNEAMYLKSSEFYKECKVVGNIHENVDLLGENR